MDDIYAQQGNDITGADMILPPVGSPSKIVKFYSGSTVFITGATGFLGRLFLEKLLRAVPDIKRIYVIIRPKKGKDTQKRFEEIFEGPSFDPLRRKQPNYLSKVSWMEGDCYHPNLGISEADRTTLIKEVDCIIHCAATVRFTEQLTTAVNINVRATRDLITMAKQMKNLKVMVHVSTAFSFCTRQNIDEVLYEPPIEGSKLIALTELLDIKTIDQITPTLLGPYPNTYAFTKGVAENIVNREAKSLPIVVFRPSIVIASIKEPVAGWIDNYYGATGILVGAAIGLLRTLHAVPDCSAEVVPADYVVNCALAAAWDTATIKSINDNEELKKGQARWEDKFEENIPVYNYVSAPESRITWNDFSVLSKKHAIQVPSELQIWFNCFHLIPNKWLFLVAKFFMQTLPAYLVDFIAVCLGKKPMLVEGYKKIDKFSTILTYFTTREFIYTNNNVQNLWKKLNPLDKELFEFSMKNFDWNNYWHYYVRGARVYLLKDPLETLPKGKIWNRKLKIAHYGLLTVLAIIGIQLLLYVWGLL